MCNTIVNLMFGGKFAKIYKYYFATTKCSADSDFLNNSNFTK